MEKHKDRFPFGEFLRELRKKSGASLRKVEEDTGIPNVSLWMLETGERRRFPNPDRLRLLSEYYNVSVKELLEKAGYFEAKEEKNMSNNLKGVKVDGFEHIDINQFDINQLKKIIKPEVENESLIKILDTIKNMESQINKLESKLKSMIEILKVLIR